MSNDRLVQIAAVQAEPVWLDLQRGVDKVISIIQEASDKGANVLGFPEVFIPGYPWSIWARSPVNNVAHRNEYFWNSLEREFAEMDRIRAVREAGIFVILGYSERHNGSMYIAQNVNKDRLEDLAYSKVLQYERCSSR